MMVPKTVEKFFLDPIEELDGVLEYTWQTLCDYYVAGGSLPDIRTLFRGADVNQPQQAAETVLANMMVDLSEGICRFSPWYTKPPRAFGIAAFRDLKTGQCHHRLMPEAAQQWEKLLTPLGMTIRQNKGMIQAIIYVETLTGDAEEDECVTALCECNPPHTIRLYQSSLKKMEIYCSICRQPFRKAPSS